MYTVMYTYDMGWGNERVCSFEVENLEDIPETLLDDALSVDDSLEDTILDTLFDGGDIDDVIDIVGVYILTPVDVDKNLVCAKATKIFRERDEEYQKYQEELELEEERAEYERLKEKFEDKE